MAQRRIVFFSPGWPPTSFPNGIVTYIANVRGALKEFGFDSRILAAQRAESDRDPEAFAVASLAPKRSFANRVQDSVLWRMAPGKSVVLTAGRDINAALAALNVSFPYDLIEIEETWGVAESVRRAAAVPVVLRLHGPWFLNGPALGGEGGEDDSRRIAQEGHAIVRATAITAPSADVLEKTRRFYNVSLDGAEVVPYPGPVVPAGERWDAATCRRNVVLFVGRFDRHKGGDIAIDAFCEVAKDNPELELLFVGPDRGFVDDRGKTWSMRTYLEQCVPDAGIRDRVRVLGQRQHAEIGALRREAFATIVCSRYETFCIAALEALAYGCPLLASDAGGIPEMMRPGETALTFRSGDVQDMAAKLRLLLSDSALALSLSAKARADYEARFAPIVVAKQTARFYERTLARCNR